MANRLRSAVRKLESTRVLLEAGNVMIRWREGIAVIMEEMDARGPTVKRLWHTVLMRKNEYTIECVTQIFDC